MSRTADVDGFQLTVPNGWWVWKYDESRFHQNQFQSFSRVKAVDAVALEHGHTLWLIEVKDYRRNKRSKPSSVFDEVASKVRDTLAGLAVARVRAMEQQERVRARQALNCTEIRVVLQLAQSGNPHRLFPQVVDPLDGALKLKKAVKQVDSAPILAAGSVGAQNAALRWTTVQI